MSKKTSTKAKNFHFKPSSNIPPLGPIQTNWNLKEHYYTSETDPQIEKDAIGYERKVKAFVKKYQTSDFTASSAKLLAALMSYEALENLTEGSKVIRYFSFRATLNVNDNQANRKLSLYSERFRKLSNEMLFFPLTIGKIAKPQQEALLKDDRLKKYHYLLKQNFEEARHHLSEKEERILALRSNTSSGMWAEAVEKVISNRNVTFRGKNYALPEALEHISLLSWTQKNELWQKILEELYQISEFAEHELTAVVQHEKVSAELRSYKKPYSATVRSYENNEKAVEALVEAISTKGFALSRKFYAIKAKLHGKKSIPYVNKYDPIGDLPRPDFETSVTVCRDTFYSLDSAFGSIFDRMLEKGHIDVYPKAGKRGGAFESNAVGLPTYVMLNHKDDFKSLETMAHEIGHAIHGELSKVQPAFYQDFSITTAETASTLFEQLAMKTIMNSLDDNKKIIFLHDKITRDIASIQRQIACFNFELAMHNHIREHGLITKEELATLMQYHMQSYLGPAVEVTLKDGYSFVYWHHIRYGFYVYTYAYGHLISNLMIRKYLQDNNFLTEINSFLHSGGSDTVENIFNSIGINTRKVETFLTSLKTQEEEIIMLEQLTRQQ